MTTRHALPALLSLLLAGPPALAAPAAPATPVAATASFYRAYINRFRSDQDPMLDLALEGNSLVSTSLLQELRTRMDSDADPDDDYFLHSPRGVRPCHSADVVALKTTRDSATVRVTLAARRTPAWQLAVALAKDGRAWHIRSVAPSGATPSHQAAVRAMSDC